MGSGRADNGQNAIMKLLAGRSKVSECRQAKRGEGTMRKKIQNLIVGAGISGAVLARTLAEAGQKCLILDKRGHVGGNCYDYKDGNGILLHRYGPHIFHTNDRKVWDFLSRFTRWTAYTHKVKGLIDGQEVPVPFNFHSLYALFPKKEAVSLEKKLLETFGPDQKIPILSLRQTQDKELHFLAQYIYEKVFLHYTLKQWGVPAEELDRSVMDRVPVVLGWDDRYFQDAYQAMPSEGYTALFENMLAHPNIAVRLKAEFSAVCKEYAYERLFYSGPIDEYFRFAFGALPYRSLHFEMKEFPQPRYQSAAVINYPNDFDYTRVTEYKYFLPYTCRQTVAGFEYPLAHERGKNERFYPIPQSASQALYRQYAAAAREEKNVRFFGRLGGYKYCDMQTAVQDALALAQDVLTGG